MSDVISNYRELTIYLGGGQILHMEQLIKPVLNISVLYFSIKCYLGTYWKITIQKCIPSTSVLQNEGDKNVQ